MNARLLAKYLFTGAAVLALSGCGGGGSAGLQTGFGPSPTPTPTPTPAPQSCTGAQCLKAVDIFPGVTSTTDFATLGLEASKGGVSAASLVKDGFSVQYNAEAGVYVFQLPSSSPAGFYENIANSPNSRFWNGEIADAPTNTVIGASVYQPRSTNPQIQLTYTTYAMYGDLYNPTEPFGFLAFGEATPQSGIPVTGSATYSAQLKGSTLDEPNDIEGSATLNFDFAAGKLTGHLDPGINDGLGGYIPLGRYDFVNTIYASGDTTFSGSLSNVNQPTLGAFEGQFTGPAAEELMARWTAPYANSSTHTNSEMFGVLVGKH